MLHVLSLPSEVLLRLCWTSSFRANSVRSHVKSICDSAPITQGWIIQVSERHIVKWTICESGRSGSQYSQMSHSKSAWSCDKCRLYALASWIGSRAAGGHT